jgi:endonuclease VIII
MPEGHLLHRAARDHAAGLTGPLEASSPQGRFTAGAEAVDGLRLVHVEAYGKHLFHHVEGGAVVHVHLGMRGVLIEHPPPAPPPRPQVRLRLGGERLVVDLIAPQRCELLDEAGRDALVAGLGPDPLRDDADPELAWERLQATGRPLAAALLDQSVVAGPGNVFRAEVLHACHLDPFLPARELDRPAFDRLWQTLGDMMRQAVEDGRIITVAPPSGVARTDLPQDEARVVYKQQRCRHCGGAVAAAELDGRTLHWCTACQGAGDGAVSPGGGRATS